MTIQPTALQPSTYTASLRILCLLVLLVILVAGLWPFHTPKNNATWTADGLWLSKYGMALSEQPFRNAESKTNMPCSFEIWLEPARVDKRATILAYYRPNDLESQMLLRQYDGNLIFARGDLNRQRRGPFTGIYAAKVFRNHRPVFLSITSGQEGTVVYADGVPVQRSSSFRFSSDDLAGQLMFGNAPAALNVWSGMIRGFAMYDRQLSPDEVTQHYAHWAHHEETILAGIRGTVALYSFSERSGSIVHNQVDPATNLQIPPRFFVPGKKFLEAPGDEFHPSWSYWESDITNVLGFIPLGFFFCALFCSTWRVRQSLISTIILGFAISLTIEVLQGFLPTRSSGTTDLFTNTLGTALGAIAYTTPKVRNWLGRFASFARLPESVGLTSDATNISSLVLEIQQR